MKPSTLLSLFLIADSIFLFSVSILLRDPVLLKFRDIGLIAINLIGVIWLVIAAMHRHKKEMLKNISLLLALASMAISLGKETSFQYKKSFIQSYDKKVLATYATHILVGFRGEKELDELLALPVFGFFVSKSFVYRIRLRRFSGNK